MANFFDSDLGAIFDELSEYMQSHTAAQMLADILASKIDPNDLPSLGDQAMRVHSQFQHGAALYAEGIRQLEASPQLLAPDCNLFFAKRNLCVCFWQGGSPVEAERILFDEPKLIAADVSLALMVVRALAEVGHVEKANVILSAIDRIPLPGLLSKLEAAELDLDFVNAVRAEVRKVSGVRKMRDLNWLSASGAELPDRLLDMNLDQLAKHGIPTELLSTIKTAVLLGSGQDRKMWNCGFFDLKDPLPLLARGMTGCFRVLFHNRLGKYGEDGGVTVFGVYRD